MDEKKTKKILFHALDEMPRGTEVDTDTVLAAAFAAAIKPGATEKQFRQFLQYFAMTS